MAQPSNTFDSYVIIGIREDLFARRVKQHVIYNVRKSSQKKHHF